MLRNTFIHIPGIGARTETKIWKAGINTWKDFLGMRTAAPLPEERRDHAARWVEESMSALDELNPVFFATRLPSREMWRAYPTFQKSSVFLDIETTDLPCNDNTITCIGLYDGTEPKLFVEGFNLEGFLDEIQRYQLVVTFNGACFDLPVIRAAFPDVCLPPLHLDLRYLLRRLGYSGGLKIIEQRLGIRRGERIDGLSGFDAVRLWREYERGSVESLKVLMEYNIADVVNLKELTEVAYNSKLATLPCYSPLIPVSHRMLSEEEISACAAAIGL